MHRFTAWLLWLVVVRLGYLLGIRNLVVLVRWSFALS